MGVFTNNAKNMANVEVGGWGAAAEGGALEDHQQYNHLESRSDAKMTAFLPGPLQYPHLDKDNKDAAPPGCGPAAIEALNGKEIFTLHQLCGQFMLLDRDVNLMLQWMKDAGYSAGWEATTLLAIAKKMHGLLEGGCGGGELPAKHMAYAQLQMKSDQKLIEFLSGPLQRDLTVVPGCGPAGVKALAAAEIFTLDQLCGKFMTFDRDPTLMVQWLEEIGFASGWSETATHALGAKLQSLLD